MFAKEVSKYCKSNTETVVPKCKHDLLSYGVAKLEQMNESHLDAMDPYQRSANDISKYHFFFHFIYYIACVFFLIFREISKKRLPLCFNMKNKQHTVTLGEFITHIEFERPIKLIFQYFYNYIFL